jgi:transcription antitermination factor NusG
MYINSSMDSQVPPAQKVDDAVGVSNRQWFVAIVGRNTEKACRERLAALGYESYVATQIETRVWRTGQKKEVERVLISNLLFIHATERERLEIVKLPYINYFLTNKAGHTNDFGRHPLAVIPDSQMDMLRFMLYHADSPVTFTSEPLHLGDRIRVIRGQLAGCEGYVAKEGNQTHLVVRIDFLGSAQVTISSDDLEKIV